MKSISEDFKKPEEFIHNILNRLTTKQIVKYPHKTFYAIDDKIYFEMLSKINSSQYLYCLYEDFWYVLESKYNLNDKQIQSIIKNMFEYYIKQDIGTPVKIITNYMG